MTTPEEYEDEAREARWERYWAKVERRYYDGLNAGLPDYLHERPSRPDEDTEEEDESDA